MVKVAFKQVNEAPEIVNSKSKYLIEIGKEFLGDDTYITYVPVERGSMFYYLCDDEAFMKRNPRENVYIESQPIFNNVVIVKVVGDDEMDLIAGNITQAEVNKVMALSSELMVEQMFRGHKTSPKKTCRKTTRNKKPMEQLKNAYKRMI